LAISFHQVALFNSLFYSGQQFADFPSHRTCAVMVVGKNSDNVSLIKVNIKSSINTREASAMADYLAVGSLLNRESAATIEGGSDRQI
jgi:hypothetical protein